MPSFILIRPTGCSTAALIGLLQAALTILSSNAYVRVFAVDFSKAFDTVRHATLIEKMTKLQMPDQVINWIKDFLDSCGPRKQKFNRIRQVAPMCPHGKTHCRHLANTIAPSELL